MEPKNNPSDSELRSIDSDLYDDSNSSNLWSEVFEDFDIYNSSLNDVFVMLQQG